MRPWDLWLIAVCALAGGTLVGGQARAPLSPFVERAAAYVAAYQRQLTAIVADETYTQRITGQIPFDATMPRSRTVRSEIFFMFLPGERWWMAIRDVAAVDGRPAVERPDLRAALRALPAAEVAGRFKAYNSRFNLGRVVRNFNEPTLSLLVLDAAHRPRFTFQEQRADRRDGLVGLAFAETLAPTLIRDLSLRAIFSQGEFTVERETGAIVRALLKVTIGGVRMELDTSYALDPRLGMRVPSSFRERYEDGRAPGDARRRLLDTRRYEEIVCEARYTNFRRFEATSRIK
jgi:hypothetical protein